MIVYINKEKVKQLLAGDFSAASKVIDKMETEDVAPVVHGKWTKDYDECCYHWICSVCKGDIPRDKYQDEMLSDYCPNCGAKMDLK